MGLAAVTLDGRRTGAYERHRPETTTLYAVVRDNVETLYAAVASGFEGAALPPFVRRELEGYLDCGLLCRGFARLKCESCAEQHLVAFACKGRGICPSCVGRRMCQTAANLPARQYKSAGAPQRSVPARSAALECAQSAFRAHSTPELESQATNANANNTASVKPLL